MQIRLSFPNNSKFLSLVAGSLLTSAAIISHAENLNIRLQNEFGTPLLRITHLVGGLEGSDIYESSFLPAPSPYLDIFAVQNFGSTQFSVASFPTNSYSSVTNQIWGRGLALSISAQIKPTISDPLQDHAFTNKSIFGDLYSVTNGVRANLLRTDNLRSIAATNGTIPVTVTNGYCFQFEVRFLPANTPPSAGNQTNNVQAEAPQVLNLYGHDGDAGSVLSFGIVTNPANGTILNMVSNQVIYQSAMNYYGADSFVYSVDDGLATNQGTVSLNVTPLSRQPFFTGASVSDGQMNLNAMVQPNRELRVMATDSLENSWQAVQTQSIVWSTDLLVPYTNSFPATNTSRLFRLQSVVP